MLYDSKQVVLACEDEPSLIFNIIKKKDSNLVDYLISNNIVNINTCDKSGYSVMMKLIKAKEYELILKFMNKRSWDINYQDLDGNTFGHILAKDNSVSALKVMEKLTKKKNYISNITNNKNQTALDIAINANYTCTAFKILEDKRFTNIDFSSFKSLYNTYINNTYYGKYSKINNLDTIIINLDKKELVPSMRKFIDKVIDNLDIIKKDIMKNNSLSFEKFVNYIS